MFGAKWPPGGQKKHNIFNISQFFFWNVLKTQEMLNMLNAWPFWAQFGPKHLTYLTFPLFRAPFAKNI